MVQKSKIPPFGRNDRGAVEMNKFNLSHYPRADLFSAKLTVQGEWDWTEIC